MSLGDILEAMKWLFEAYGMIGSILIPVIVWQAWLLHQEQKESREVREKMASALERQVQVQIEFKEALFEAREAVRQALVEKDQKYVRTSPPRSK